ncbi:MAG: 23S rRNA (adenine(2503)-C(2))-methyltransferase RlmN [Chlamydiae bacterium]|nr:23S rRNA (adenine(2503)-C(2))-methyltransferase RlmN [Chlamydiota bacterium]
MKSFYAVSLQELEETCKNLGEPAFRARQIWDFVYKKKTSSWQQMSNVGKKVLDQLREQFSLEGLHLELVEESKDSETRKFLWKLEDGKFVESVLIYAPGRRTVCVSSQVGCPARCAFCASGKEGLFRNLLAWEIFAQVFLIDRFLHTQGESVSHVVYMGMGEPLENYDAVVTSIRWLAERLGFSGRRMTVSTVGVVENITRLAQEEITVNLVLSLHAPSQHIRKKIIPYARRYELSDVLDAMRKYAGETKRDITYEYTLLAGINDKEEDAEALAQLVAQDPCTVNLIPYNPVEGLHLQRPPKEKIEVFRRVLEAKGIVTTWRYTKGKDIAAACGQLAVKKQSPLKTLSENG